MDIKALVRELLFSHDCVIIPGFGGFIGNYSPARIDQVSGLFYPPFKRISFNSRLNHNDGLLISRISLVRGTNYSDSRRLVEEFVRDLNSMISRGERIVFDHVGIVFPNPENKLQFEPETDVNYLVGSFGLESFQCLPLDEYDVRRRVVRHISRDPVKHSQVRKNLWRAAVVIPILALLVAVPLKTGMFRDTVETTSLNPLVTAEFENNKKAVDEAGSTYIMPPKASPSDSTGSVITPADSTPALTAAGKSSVSEPDGSQPIESRPMLTEIAVPEKAAAALPVKSGYVIVTGSFRSEENALSHVRDLKSDGFTPEIVMASNGYFRVYAIKCPDMKTALFRKDSISKKFPGTWITKF